MKPGLLVSPAGAFILAVDAEASPAVTLAVAGITFVGTIITLVVTTRSNRRSFEAKNSATQTQGLFNAYEKLLQSLMDDLKLQKEDAVEQRKQINRLRALHEECEKGREEDRFEGLRRSEENSQKIRELEALLQERTRP